MRTRVHAGFVDVVMPGSGAFPTCAVMHREVFNN
ncbi:hypothetical protein P3T16_000676 [Paraburkholderia sp. GAS42]|jgi:hypothetical protein